MVDRLDFLRWKGIPQTNFIAHFNYQLVSIKKRFKGIFSFFASIKRLERVIRREAFSFSILFFHFSCDSITCSEICYHLDSCARRSHPSMNCWHRDHSSKINTRAKWKLNLLSYSDHRILTKMRRDLREHRLIRVFILCCGWGRQPTKQRRVKSWSI